jgi:hypothetical protein
MTRRPYRPNVWHSALDELKGATVFEEERLTKSTRTASNYKLQLHLALSHFNQVLLRASAVRAG